MSSASFRTRTARSRLERTNHEATAPPKNAKRMVKILPGTIYSHQTGFVKVRYINQNIRLIKDVMEQTKLQNIPGILLLLDFWKVFDAIELSFIQNTLNFFNFGVDILNVGSLPFMLAVKVRFYATDVRQSISNYQEGLSRAVLCHLIFSSSRSCNFSMQKMKKMKKFLSVEKSSRIVRFLEFLGFALKFH